jgi:hypothetical protein
MVQQELQQLMVAQEILVHMVLVVVVFSLTVAKIATVQRQLFEGCHFNLVV